MSIICNPYIVTQNDQVSLKILVKISLDIILLYYSAISSLVILALRLVNHFLI